MAGIFAAMCHAISWLVLACISVRLQGGCIKSFLFVGFGCFVCIVLMPECFRAWRSPDCFRARGLPDCFRAWGLRDCFSACGVGALCSHCVLAVSMLGATRAQGKFFINV